MPDPLFVGRVKNYPDTKNEFNEQNKTTNKRKTKYRLVDMDCKAIHHLKNL